MYYNYKKCYSVVLMAVVDAHYNFVVVDFGGYGKQSDGNVLANSTFGKKLLNMYLALPPPEPITGTSELRLPFIFVGDEAFPLLPNILRPYPGDYIPYEKSVYNCRLSRARRVVENAFGILASKFRCLRRPMIMSPNNAERFSLERWHCIIFCGAKLVCTT